MRRPLGRWIQSERAGDIGIDKTLESSLGIDKNNFPGPDGEKVELKDALRVESMTTLITKSPEPRPLETPRAMCREGTKRVVKSRPSAPQLATSFDTTPTTRLTMMAGARQTHPASEAPPKQYNKCPPRTTV